MISFIINHLNMHYIPFLNFRQPNFAMRRENTPLMLILLNLHGDRCLLNDRVNGTTATADRSRAPLGSPLKTANNTVALCPDLAVSINRAKIFWKIFRNHQ